MSHCTATETITGFNSSIRRPMSTSIIPSLSLDSRPPSSKRASTPYHTPTPKRPSSTSQAALASSQSRVALNLLKRFSTQNSIRPSDCSPSFIVRDFAFKPSDPRHTGHRLTNNNNLDESTSFQDLNKQIGELRRSSSKMMFWNICASPTGPGSTAESELDRDQEEAEQSIEIDKLIHKYRQDSNDSSNPPDSTIYQQQILSENGSDQALTRLTSKHENLYVSLYEFVAEGESEMNLSKGEIVGVLEIICDGWVVARKTNLIIDDDGKLFHSDFSPVLIDDLIHFSLPSSDEFHHLSLTGLCPENYLLKIS